MKGPIVKPEAGRLGMAIATSGLAVAAVSMLVAPSIGPMVLLGGAALYLVGAALGVAAFGYQRGSKLFLALRVMRLIFAAIVIFSILRLASG